MEKKDLRYFKQLLLKLQEELNQELSALEDEAKPVSPDKGLGRLTRQEALQAQSVALQTLAQRKLRAKKVSFALQRIDSGEYGVCLDCGEDIPYKRLEIQPEAVLCVECAAIRQKK